MANKRKTVLITPLDWGLGHATRCIPIVNYLLEHGVEVILASNGRPYQLLKKEFPDLIIRKLPSYDIRYYSDSIHLNIAIQFYKLFTAIVGEHQTTKKIVEEHQVDAIISDNRFGCSTKNTKNIFISHQLHLIAGPKMLEKGVNSFNHFFIRKFDACWIPDFQGEVNLSGKLSHPSPFPNTQYLGALTRIKPMQLPKKYDVAFVLSGPEPQRTRLEKKILEQIKTLPYKMLVVQGKPEKNEQSTKDNLDIFSYMTGAQLNKAIASSDLVVCRSGYSTIMDLVALGKKALLIPTPGQTEQEYLAGYYENQQISITQNQSELDLAVGIPKALEYSGFGKFSYSQDQLGNVLDAFLSDLHNEG